jgi:hypothetical protein
MFLDPDPDPLFHPGQPNQCGSMHIRIHNTVLNRIIFVYSNRSDVNPYLLIHLAVAGQEEGERLARPRLGDRDEVSVRHGHRPRLRLRSPSNQNYNRSIKAKTNEQSINRAGFGDGDKVPVRRGHRPRLRLRSPSIKITIDQ